MICSNLHQLLNIDFNITYLSSTEMNAKDKKNEFVCTKGMRPYSRLFYILDGETCFTFKGRDGMLKSVNAYKGDIVYLPDDIEYRSFWTNPNLMNHISIEFCLKEQKGNPVLLNEEIFIIANDRYALHLQKFIEINTQWSAGTLGYKLKCKSILFDLIRTIAMENLKSEYREYPNSIYKSIIYIENNYIGEISVKELAKMSNMCETSFRQKFSKQIGMSPIEYKNYLRIKKAAELLKSGAYTVTEAAESVNISDIYYFSKLFKRQYKIPPREYQKQSKIL